jgi:tetratricopeptide (TPR) repeat protein
MTKIYVSSTYSDLVEHRRQVYDNLRKMRYDVIAMEDYVATDERPLEKCLADVASCDAYIGIFAWRYGYVPPGQERSITELEYRQAGQSGRERLIFLLDEDAPWPRKYMDEVTGKGEGGRKIKALRKELMAAHLVQFFKSPEEMVGQVAASVAQWAEAQLDAEVKELRASRDQADRERREMRDRQRVVNIRPLDVTHTFKDRLREMRDLCDHLVAENVRLVSVVGRGGMGKTALASRVLADLERGILPVPGEERELPIDGILYLSARSTGLGLERIYADVGRMLGEPAASRLAARWADRDAPLAAKIEYLLEAMRDGLYLILLDNLEEELTEDGDIVEEGLRLFVERCLTQADGVKLIATSREEVGPAAAALHSARSIPLREGLPEDEAVALLRDLDPQGTLGLHDAPEEDLRRAAQMTEGIPRALEILAGILQRDPTARLPKLPADEAAFGAEVVEQLVAEGYRSLGEDEQRVMEALAVFDRPVRETAITYLLHPWFPGLDVRAGLRRLVSGYFVTASRVTSQYSLHPLDRNYAYRQIPDEIERGEGRGERGEGYTRRNLDLRAADFYVSMRKPETDWKMIDDLAPQLAEFEHRVRAGDYDGAYGVLRPIDSEYLHPWGHYALVVEMGEKLLGRLPDDGWQVDILGSVGRACRALGEIERTVELCEEALAIACKIGDRQREGMQLGNLGRAYIPIGELEQAMEFDKQALDIAREIGDRRRESELLGHHGNAYRARGEFERAIELHEEALAIAREEGDRAEEGRHLGNLGHVYFSRGEAKEAIECHKKALAIARDIGHRRVESYQLLWLSQAQLAEGKLSEAQRHCEKALSLGVPETSYQAALAKGVVLLHKRNEAAAREAFAEAESRSWAMLDKTARLYEARYTLATARVGSAVCDPRWAEESERDALLAPAREEYQRALENCAAQGVVGDALRDLEMIQKVGGPGLESVMGILAQD